MSVVIFIMVFISLLNYISEEEQEGENSEEEKVKQLRALIFEEDLGSIPTTTHVIVHNHP